MTALYSLQRCHQSEFCSFLVRLLQERGLSAYPFIEICKGDLIHYMCPLENQDSFFVPELLEKQTGEEEETVKDKDTDDMHAGMTL